MSSFPFNQATEGQQQSQASTSSVDLPSYGQPGVATPAIDVVDTPEEIWVFVDLPGFTEDETTIRADENTVLVTAERREETVEGQNTLLRERPRKFERTLQLHAPVDTADAEATYEHGVCGSSSRNSRPSGTRTSRSNNTTSIFRAGSRGSTLGDGRR